MYGNELSRRIMEIITVEPGIYQNKIVEILNVKQGESSKTTIRRCLDELVADKIIHSHKNAGHVTYTASNVDNVEDIERSLRHHLDKITELIEKTRNGIPDYHYQVKSDLNEYFENMADRIDDKVRNNIEYYKQLQESKIPYITDARNDLNMTLTQLSNDGQISKMDYETLHNVVTSIYLKMSSIDERFVEACEQFSKVRDKNARDSINEKLSDIDGEMHRLFEELKKIKKYIQYTPDRLDEIVDTMHKRYVEGRPDVVTEILHMLGKYETSDDKFKLKLTVSKITHQIRGHEDQQMELHKKCKDVSDMDYLDYLQGQISDEKIAVKGLETTLSEIRGQLILKKSLDRVVTTFDRLDGQD